MSDQDKQSGGSSVNLDDLVASTDTGARQPAGSAGKVLLGVALFWSLFQLWYASPLPFIFGFGIFNSTEARSIHLALAVFLAFTAYPAFAKSPRDYIPIVDWALAGIAAFCAGYLFLFYTSLSDRPGQPTWYDVAVACVGMITLMEATRRALGPPLMIVAMVFLSYTFLGPYMPEVIAYGGASLNKVASHQWLTTEGVFGIALGVSTSFVFLFVLFGSLLDKAGAGNYFIKVAFAMLGHMRGGPAKAAVVSSGMTGLISGSSIANVVTTGTFTIPLMKRVGFTGEKAGAVEVASSVNGQIMPPVMGAAAFLMVEYVGIPYTDVVKHAFLPAIISYIALVYIVHLEALKADMKGLPKPVTKTFTQAAIGYGLTAAGFIILCGLVYYGLGWMKDAFGGATPYIASVAIAVVYIGLLKFAAGYPELEVDDPDAPVVSLPEVGPTVKTGLHYLLPVFVLVWCLMIERLSPGLSAFWATALMIFILITQRPILAAFRGIGDRQEELKRGWDELMDGLITGARNMIGIGVATAAAGVIVGTVSLTGVGLKMTALVEILSFGNVLLMLALTGIISLILGMGLPTTANYIVVSTLMAPVVVELGAQNGLIVPLIAVHLFVFYFGIMADVTPPVGLASFAAAAVSGADPIKTGFTAFYYSMRTVALPFIFIFNTQILLIGIEGPIDLILTVVSSTIAMLVFAAATQGYFFARTKAWEVVVLLLVAFTLFRPGFWWDMIYPPLVSVPAAEIEQELGKVPPGDNIRLKIAGLNIEGNFVEKTVVLALGEGTGGIEKLASSGIELREEDGKAIVDNVGFGSPAEKAGVDFDMEVQGILMPNDRPPKELMFIPALIVLAGIIFLQRGRRRNEATA